MGIACQAERATPVEAMRLFAAWLKNADSEAEFMYGYSGRFMYGMRCVGIVGGLSEIQTALMDFALSNPAMGEIIREIVKTQRVDNMGLDVIIYFPGVDIDPPPDD